MTSTHDVSICDVDKHRPFKGQIQWEKAKPHRKLIEPGLLTASGYIGNQTPKAQLLVKPTGREPQTLPNSEMGAYLCEAVASDEEVAKTKAFNMENLEDYLKAEKEDTLMFPRSENRMLCQPSVPAIYRQRKRPKNHRNVGEQAAGTESRMAMRIEDSAGAGAFVIFLLTFRLLGLVWLCVFPFCFLF